MAEHTGGASFKTGQVKAIDAARGMARVQFADLDGMVSGWLPVLVTKSLQDRDYHMPDVGEHVACLLDACFEHGVVLGAIYSDADQPPVRDADKRHTRFADGAVIEYDRQAHRYLVDVPAGGCIALRCGASRVDITAKGIKLQGPRIDLNGE